MTLPPFHASNEADRDAMREHVLSRLFEDDIDNRNWERIKTLPLQASDIFASEKRAARKGNVQPLAELLSTVMDDPEIAAFIAMPPRGRGKRKNDRLHRLKKAVEKEVIDTVRRVRQIWREDFGKVKRDRNFDESAEKIAAYVYRLSEDEVLQIMRKASPA